MTTSGRFTGALGQRPEESSAPEPMPEPTPMMKRSKRTMRQVLKVRVEPTYLIQARVRRSHKGEFKKTLVDLQDYFEQEVTQEEAIGALLVLASQDAEVREKWMDVIDQLRAEE